MRKVILNVAVSLDGFIEGPNGEYDWCFTDDDYGMTAFIENTDAIFIGRKSYELIANETHEWYNKKTYVFTDTLDTVKPNAEIVRGADLVSKVEAILNEPGKSIWLFGGASLVSAMLKHNYIHELMLSVHPIVLGAGKPLFEDLKERLPLTLTNSITFSSGLVQLYYKV
ncbi:dihydrofolate reductase [Mucilaginibacter limnophilus]|uniref:Dihydrofolate reductase n=1 Tax=Mucilaginibacter limnophilus TaxID=1932778 RepID=A0A437MWH1_9SPHI|nr:dihydrofolate reductase family protein [Mucilaginibacter limnophilus]RVU02003.1 dihydrofolate reductase [Mucilaginibacter limnophilus]